MNILTHVKGHSLDLVITEDANGVEIFSCGPGPFNSDHCALKVVTKVKRENIVTKSVVYRNFKDMNGTQITKDLAELSIDSEYVDQYI